MIFQRTIALMGECRSFMEMSERSEMFARAKNARNHKLKRRTKATLTKITVRNITPAITRIVQSSGLGAGAAIIDVLASVQFTSQTFLGVQIENCFVRIAAVLTGRSVSCRVRTTRD